MEKARRLLELKCFGEDSAESEKIIAHRSEIKYI